MNDQDNQYPTVAQRANDVGRIVRLVIIGVVIAVLVIVALDNTDDVRIGYAIGETEAPVLIVVVAAAVAGFVIGWLVKHRPRRKD